MFCWKSLVKPHMPGMYTARNSKIQSRIVLVLCSRSGLCLYRVIYFSGMTVLGHDWSRGRLDHNSPPVAGACTTTGGRPVPGGMRQRSGGRERSKPPVPPPPLPAIHLRYMSTSSSYVTSLHVPFNR